MSLLWAVPPVAVVVATVLVFLQLREMATATDDIGVQLRRLHEVPVAVAAVRAEAVEVRASVQRLRSH